MSGGEGVPSQILSAIMEDANESREPLLLEKEEFGIVMEPVYTSGTVFIFGAGHVSKALSLFTRQVDFYTVVIDDRTEFANRERFDTADEVLVIDRYETAFKDLMIDENSYIIIVTRGHRHDKTVLAQALGTNAGYVGMIGSRTKRDTIYKQLISEGVSRKQIDGVYSPIGMAISAHTPEEIAVSIVGELIKVRAEKAGYAKF